MKLNVSKRAQTPATNYFNSQAAICCIWTLLAAFMTVMGLIMHNKIKDVLATTTNTEDIPKEYADTQSYSDRIYIYGLVELAAAICLGSLMVFLAKYILESGNGTCMRVCCVLDGIGGTADCCSGIGICIMFFLVLAAWIAMGDPAKVCAGVTSQLVSTTAAPPVGTATPNCEKFITGLKPAIGLFACLLCCMGSATLKVAGLLCFAAKNANECADIFDQEDGGNYDDFDADNAY